MNVIETHGLTKRYRRKLAVDNLDMTVAAGDIYGFVGKNGSGKSTTMKMVAGLARPTAGEVASSSATRSAAAPPRRASRASAPSSRARACCRASPRATTSSPRRSRSA